jgi:vancomycin resistance protein VanW
MNINQSIDKPINRGWIRKKIGREYYIFKRYLDWITKKKEWTKISKNSNLKIEVKHHKSMILRPLKDVDMYLQENKRTNLRIAINKLNDTLIKPGQTFSLWKQVGRPTARKGYLEGLVLNQGKIDKGIGGGLCQLGNLLFWIFAHSPLDITERYRHGFDVFPDVNRKVPFGAGATLSYNYIDLQIYNPTDQTFQLKLWLDETHLHGQLNSKEKIERKYSIEERNHLIKQQLWGGYSRHNQIVKICEDITGEKSETLLVENHALMMYTPFLSD